MTWGELDSRANVVARLFADMGVTSSSTVVVAVPNGVTHVVTCSAAWKLGACVLPLNPAAPAPERDQHLDLAQPALVVADWSDLQRPALTPAAVDMAQGSDAALPDVMADPGKAIGTGGSTGRPKLIVTPGPWAQRPEAAELFGRFGFRPDQVQLLPGPLHHNFGFDWCYQGLLHRHTVVLMERFEASLAVELVERHRVQYAGLVPTMMRRIVQLPDIEQRDLSSLEAVLHSAGPCPAWVKERWIELVGAKAVIEGYGASEAFGNTVIRGDEWLEHRGSVGRPLACELVVLDEAGEPVPNGTVGEIWMRRPDVGDRYLGDQRARLRPDGFGSVGDLGWVDDDGYLYLADRRTDLIVTGGVNVYPAEVEGALSSHPAVHDVAVIGLPDDEWGKRVHAIVVLEPHAPQPTDVELREHCLRLLERHKLPRSFEFLPSLARDDGGKLRRAALVAERVVERSGA